MSPNSLKRKMIESVVVQGISDIRQDHKRGVRKLADMGRYFSKSKIHKGIFTIIQDILQDDDSLYYEAVEYALENVETSILKTFGMNFGYNSLTYGASIINSLEREFSHKIPWIIALKWNTENKNLDLTKIQSIITEGKSLGIYSYCIQQDSYGTDWENIADLFRNNPDCAFFWYFNTEVSDDHNFLSPLDNVMVLLNSKNKNTLSCTEALRKRKAFYAIVKEYSSVEEVTPNDVSSINRVYDFGTPLVLYIAKDGCDPKVKDEVGKNIYDARLNPKAPVFFFDFFSDIKRIDSLVSIQSGALGLGFDKPLGEYDKSLKEILFDYMPKIEK